MGNKLKQLEMLSKTGNTPIGTVTTCPNCEEDFPSSFTYSDVRIKSSSLTTMWFIVLKLLSLQIKKDWGCRDGGKRVKTVQAVVVVVIVKNMMKTMILSPLKSTSRRRKKTNLCFSRSKQGSKFKDKKARILLGVMYSHTNG